jgi:putative transposase
MDIEPGSPWENGYAEGFRGRLRDEFPATEIFDGVRDARATTASWKDEDKTQRPHGSLGYPDLGQVRCRVDGQDRFHV